MGDWRGVSVTWGKEGMGGEAVIGRFLGAWGLWGWKSYSLRAIFVLGHA